MTRRTNAPYPRGEDELARRFQRDGWRLEGDWQSGAPLGWICRWLFARLPNGERKIVTSSCGHLTGIWPESWAS
jgi:hypothetical protein